MLRNFTIASAASVNKLLCVCVRSFVEKGEHVSARDSANTSTSIKNKHKVQINGMAGWQQLLDVDKTNVLYEYGHDGGRKCDRDVLVKGLCVCTTGVFSDDCKNDV